MKKFHLIYNPYYVKTTLFMKNGSVWELIGDESKINWIEDRRMQQWLLPDMTGSWKGFFEELKEASGERELEVLFSGTNEDMQDLMEAASLYQDSEKLQVKVDFWDEESKKAADSSFKLRMLQEKINEAKKSMFWMIFPEEMQIHMEKTFVSTKTMVNVFDLSRWEDKVSSEVFDRESWDLVLFTFSFADVKKREMKALFRKLAGQIQQLGNVSSNHERILFVCICNETELIHVSLAEREVKDIFMECGLSKAALYLISDEDFLYLSDHRKKEDLEVSKFGKSLLVAMEHYQRRYAEQIRLHRWCEGFRQMAEQENLHESSVLRKINVGIGDETKQTRTIEWVIDLLEGWNYRGEMNTHINGILFDFQKAFHQLQTEMKCPYPIIFQNKVDGRNKKCVKEKDSCMYQNWVDQVLVQMLRKECEWSVLNIEQKWLAVYEEILDELEYVENGRKILRSICQVGEDMNLVSPIDGLNESSPKWIFFPEDDETNDKIFDADQFFDSRVNQVKELFKKWLEEYGCSLCSDVDKVKEQLLTIAGADLKSGGYRKQLQEETETRKCAVVWVKDFLQQIDHLLDIEI